MCLSSTSQNVLRLFWIATLLLGTRTLAELHCIDPGTPDNGFIRVEQYPFSVGSKAFFACSSGYILYGADTLVCQLSTDGYGAQWSASRPNCVHALSSDTLLRKYLATYIRRYSAHDGNHAILRIYLDSCNTVYMLVFILQRVLRRYNPTR